MLTPNMDSVFIKLLYCMHAGSREVKQNMEILIKDISIMHTFAIWTVIVLSASAILLWKADRGKHSS